MELNRDNYYSREADEAFWSASFVKEMNLCPARAIARMRREWEEPQSAALLVGSYVDAAFEGTLGEFASGHPDLFNRRTGELKRDFVLAQQMVERAQSDPFFMSFFSGERQKILTGLIGGYPFKARFDFYDPGRRIVDLKTTRDFLPRYRAGEGMITFADYWQWPLQMAIYQALEGHRLPCFLAAITKESPPDIAVVEVPQETMDAEMAVLLDKLPLYDAMRSGLVEPERCEHCAYCRSTRKLTRAVSLGDFLE